MFTRVGLLSAFPLSTVCMAVLCLSARAYAGDLDPVHRGSWPGFHRAPANNVVVRGNYAYVTTQTGLHVIDVSDPAGPQSVGSTTVGGEALGLQIQGNYVFVAVRHVGLRVIDVSDPMSPRRVGGSDIGAQYPATALLGKYLYFSGPDALRIFDVSDPTNPLLMRQYAPSVVPSLPAPSSLRNGRIAPRRTARSRDHRCR